MELRASSARRAARSAWTFARSASPVFFCSIRRLSASALSNAILFWSSSRRVAACFEYKRSSDSPSRRSRAISVLVLFRSFSSCAISSCDPPLRFRLRSSSADTSCSLMWASSLLDSAAASTISVSPAFTVWPSVTAIFSIMVVS